MKQAVVLVVEDNAVTRKMMRIALQVEGYEVLEAGDGESALRLVEKQRPALVLLDCRLPDIDGFEVGRRIRLLAPGVPVIAVTGWAQTDEQRVVSAGFVDVLVKPVEPSRVVEIVERHVGRASARAQPGRVVLVADDDATQRKLAQLVLASAGFEVIVAEDGPSALRLAAARKPDAIVSDVLMSGMDGFALCKAIRSDPNLARVPVVLTSAYFVEDADRRLAARFGANEYVSRTGGFDAVVRAVLATIDVPVADFVVPPTPATDDLQAEHLRRISHQLEVQRTIGIGLVKRASMQASALSVLDSLSDSLARQLDPESALGETLDRCLDAAGVSVGAIFLCTAPGEFCLKAHVGSPPGLDWGKHTEILARAAKLGRLVVPSIECGLLGDPLLTAVGAASALILPITARDEVLGMLLLASYGTDFSGSNGESAARAARSVSSQLGLALGLNRAFSKLGAAEQRYHALLENARDAISISTPEGKILEVNGRMEELLGLPREEAIGRSIDDFAVSGRTDSNRVRDDKLISDGSGSTPPVALERPDGTVAHVEFSSTVVAVGGERFVLNIGRDVSARLVLEEQLRHAQKMEAVGKLAGGIAHDFNNVLSVILSYSELLLEDLRPGEPMRGDIEEITKAAKRAAALTKQLLMFSRQQVIQPKVLDLNEVLVGMERMLQRILGSDIDFATVLAPSLDRVRVDLGSMEQVVMNLVINARDAMPSGGKLILETANVILDEAYAHGHHGVTAGPQVMLAVSDSGCGMDRATQAHIFEPFYTTKGPGKGTGLGLSTVFGIVQQSGGTLWVYSEPGKGTTFKIYLPRVDAELDRTAAATPDGPVAARATETVLLVEDDDQVRAVAGNILRMNGYRVLEAHDAAGAMQHSEGFIGTIDLLLTDVVMPHVSGPELAKRLACLRPAMRVLCMSGYTDDSILRHGVFESNIAFIQKPITPIGLSRKVRQVLDAASAKTA